MEINGNRIRELREERGLSLAEFAAKAGISTSYLSEIERGAKKPSLKTMDKIAASLNVSLSQLVSLEQECDGGLSVGDKIRLIREESGLNLSKCAEQIGISVSYLSEIERGNVNPSVDTLKAIAKILKTPVSNLMGTGGTLGGKLKRSREEQGLTQAQLAKAAGVSPGLIGQIEHGRVQPSLQTIESLAAVLGTSPCYFIVDNAGTEEMLQLMNPEVRELLAEPNVQAVLRLVCNCTAAELKFILEFIKLYKRSGAFEEGA